MFRAFKNIKITMRVEEENVQATILLEYISRYWVYYISRYKYRLGVLQYYRSELALQPLLLYTVFFTLLYNSLYII